MYFDKDLSKSQQNNAIDVWLNIGLVLVHWICTKYSTYSASIISRLQPDLKTFSFAFDILSTITTS